MNEITVNTYRYLTCLPQTREQLQVELSSCQAKVVDLEKALAERGQVTKTRDGDRSSRVLLSLALLHVCLAALLVGWRYADQVCRRFLWRHFLPVRSHCSVPACSASPATSLCSFHFQSCELGNFRPFQTWSSFQACSSRMVLWKYALYVLTMFKIQQLFCVTKNKVVLIFTLIVIWRKQHEEYFISRPILTLFILCLCMFPDPLWLSLALYCDCCSAERHLRRPSAPPVTVNSWWLWTHQHVGSLLSQEWASFLWINKLVLLPLLPPVCVCSIACVCNQTVFLTFVGRSSLLPLPLPLLPPPVKSNRLLMFCLVVMAGLQMGGGEAVLTQDEPGTSWEGRPTDPSLTNKGITLIEISGITRIIDFSTYIMFKTKSVLSVFRVLVGLIWLSLTLFLVAIIHFCPTRHYFCIDFMPFWTTVSWQRKITCL